MDHKEGRKIRCAGCGKTLQLPSDVIGTVQCSHCHHDINIDASDAVMKSSSPVPSVPSRHSTKPTSQRYPWPSLVVVFLAASGLVYFLQHFPATLPPQVEVPDVTLPGPPPKTSTSDISSPDPSPEIGKPDVSLSGSSKVSIPPQTSAPIDKSHLATTDSLVPASPSGEPSIFAQSRVALPIAPQAPPPAVNRLLDEQLPRQWPPYTGELRGSTPIRLKNPNDIAVLVGVRSAGKGKDFTVQPRSVFSVWLPIGQYEIYFHYHNEPGVVYQGELFTLHDREMVLELVKRRQGNFHLRSVD